MPLKEKAGKAEGCRFRAVGLLELLGHLSAPGLGGAAGAVHWEWLAGWVWGLSTCSLPIPLLTLLLSSGHPLSTLGAGDLSWTYSCPAI